MTLPSKGNASQNGRAAWYEIYPGFQFHVRFLNPNTLAQSPEQICGGAFSEISGLEATVEPFQIQEGGRNYGAHQRVGRVSFAPVTLRRGLSTTRHLWDWFNHVYRGGAYGHRLDVEIAILRPDLSGPPSLLWRLRRALPVRLRLADLRASGTELAIEELHLAHEGLDEYHDTPGGGQDGQ